jgi:hypothetical protein
MTVANALQGLVDGHLHVLVLCCHDYPL